MEKIKHFMMPEHENSLYKTEGMSSIALTKLVTEKVNEMVDAVNDMYDCNIEKHQELEGMVRKGVIFMKDNLINSIHDLFKLLYESGDLEGILEGVGFEDLKNLPLRVGGFVSITEFGAVGDGIHNNTDAIQKCINYAIENNKDIYIPDGQFVVMDTLTLSDTINMYGGGQSTQNTEKSTILFDVGDMDKPLFDGQGQLGRCHFENVTFARARTSADGYPMNAYAYGKTGCCIGFHSNETSFNRCTFVGFGSVLKRSSITDFIDCDIVYCNNIIANTTLCNSISFYGGNIYACGTLLNAKGNLSTVNFTNCWIEEFERILETVGVTIMSLNFNGCTLTNTANGKEVLLYTNEPAFAREFINFNECLIYFKKEICNSLPKNIEFVMNFENSVVHYGGEGETIKISGNSKFLTLDGANSTVIGTNTGFDTKTSTAHAPITFDKVSLSNDRQIGKPNNYVETKDGNGNRMLMLPVYYEFVSNPYFPKYFVFNTQAVSTGDWVLKYVHTAGGANIEKIMVTL